MTRQKLAVTFSIGLLASAAAYGSSLIAFGCVIELPECYTLDTRYKATEHRFYAFKCFEGSELGEVHHYPSLSAFSDARNWAYVEELDPAGRFRVQRLELKNEDEWYVTDSGSALLVSDGESGLLLLGTAEKLVSDIVESCEKRPFP